MMLIHKGEFKEKMHFEQMSIATREALKYFLSRELSYIVVKYVNISI